jgi:hypothetical protein
MSDVDSLQIADLPPQSFSKAVPATAVFRKNVSSPVDDTFQKRGFSKFQRPLNISTARSNSQSSAPAGFSPQKSASAPSAQPMQLDSSRVALQLNVPAQPKFEKTTSFTPPSLLDLHRSASFAQAQKTSMNQELQISHHNVSQSPRQLTLADLLNSATSSSSSALGHFESIPDSDVQMPQSASSSHQTHSQQSAAFPSSPVNAKAHSKFQGQAPVFRQYAPVSYAAAPAAPVVHVDPPRLNLMNATPSLSYSMRRVITATPPAGLSRWNREATMRRIPNAPAGAGIGAQAPKVQSDSSPAKNNDHASNKSVAMDVSDNEVLGAGSSPSKMQRELITPPARANKEEKKNQNYVKVQKRTEFRSREHLPVHIKRSLETELNKEEASLNPRKRSRSV